MSDAIAFLRANPALIAILAALAIVTLVFGVLAILMSRAGVSLRPLVFLGVFLGIVGGPQIAFHVAQAFEWIPKRDLTWVSAKDRPPVSGLVENEAVLAATDGVFSDPLAVFGPQADPDLISDLTPLGKDGPFGDARPVQMAVLRSGGTTVVARYADARSATSAAERYLLSAAGALPAYGSDGSRTVQRPVGDYLKVLVAGRTLLALTGVDQDDLASQLRASQVLVPAAGPTPDAAADFWLYRPAVLVGLTLLLVALATVWFFKGSVWAASIPAPAGIAAAPSGELRDRLLAINSLDVPFTVEEESPSGRLVVTWRFADARWIDHARAHGMRRTHRVLLDMDESRQAVRATEQFSALDWSAGPRGASLDWKAGMGTVFFQTEHRRVFGLQLDEHGRFVPQLSYVYTFNLQEMKAPLIAATTQSGWTWRPVAWHAPSWLHWLTD
jgi:hypothetical protein